MILIIEIFQEFSKYFKNLSSNSESSNLIVYYNPTIKIPKKLLIYVMLLSANSEIYIRKKIYIKSDFILKILVFKMILNIGILKDRY